MIFCKWKIIAGYALAAESESELRLLKIVKIRKKRGNG